MLPKQDMRTHPSTAISVAQSSWAFLMICIGLAALVLLVFGGCLGNGFINLDDDFYVTGNSHVLKGLSFENLRWALSAGLEKRPVDTDYWMPLSHLSHMADVQFFGLNAKFHHGVNLILFTLSVLLLFLILTSMTGALWKSLLVTLLWALHPLRVESVAWIAERKDLLGALFFMLALASYLRTVRKPSPLAQFVLLVAFALGLMSKPILVPLPLLLLLLDYWPLHRYSSGRDLLPLIRQKLPLFGLSILSCIMTILSQKQALTPHGQEPLLIRIGNASVSYVASLGKIALPHNLAVFYPFPLHGWSLWQVIPCLLLLAGLSAGAFLVRRRYPYLCVGWFWYLVMLAPASGIIQAGDQAYADRFTLLPQIGLCLASVWLAAEWANNGNKRLFTVAAATLLLTWLMISTRLQCTKWHDSVLLMRHTIQCTRENPHARTNLAKAFEQQGMEREALEEYEDVVSLWPDYTLSHYNLATALERSGQPNAALVEIKKAITLNPHLADSESVLGRILLQKGDFNEAILHFQQAARLDPKNAETHNLIGSIALMRNDQQTALPEFKMALKLAPTNATYANNLAWTLSTCPDKSLRNGSMALELAKQASNALGSQAIVLRTLAAAYAASGNFQEAMTTALRAQELAESHGNMALAENLRHDIALYQKQKTLGE